MEAVSLIDRETGQVRSFVVDDLRPATLAAILNENVSSEAALMTDQAQYYIKLVLSLIATTP